MLAGLIGLGMIRLRASPRVFLEPASFLGVLLGTIALGMISFAPGQWLTTWRCLVHPNGRRSCGERRLAAGIFRMMAAYAIATGAVGTLLGLVVLLADLDDPARVGPGMAAALLSSLYGALLAVALIVAGTVASSSGDWTVTLASHSMKPVGVAAGAAAGAVGVALLGFVLILWAWRTGA